MVCEGLWQVTLTLDFTRDFLKKGHNTGKGLIAISPLLLPVFVSEIFPGSKSDEDILRDSGILSLTQKGDRWLADKGFIVQHVLDNYGVIVELLRNSH